MPQVIEFQSHLGRRVQKIDYESVPFTCFHCKKAGHKVGLCPLFKGKGKEGKAFPQGGKKASNAPKKEWKKKEMQVKNIAEAEEKENNIVPEPQVEPRALQDVEEAVEGGKKETTEDKINPSQVKETKENLEEASKLESQIPERSEEVDPNLSSVLNSMEDLM